MNIGLKINMAKYFNGQLTSVFLFLLYSFLFFGCYHNAEQPFDELTLLGEYEHKDEIRIDGFYVDSRFNVDIPFFYIFYNNGLVYFAACENANQIIESDFCNVDESRFPASRTDRNNWGVFNIQDRKLLFQNFMSHRPLRKPGVEEEEFMILNNSTLISLNYHDSLVFHHFHPKPDCTSYILDRLIENMN